ncbi:deoxyribodipyrimidine photolyase [bacterium]|nr:deoxyribodipyrimidine photolyase [bacterium]
MSDWSVPETRVSPVNDREIRPDGEFVVYWMVAQRRHRENFGLQHAVRHAHRLGKPLLVLEALRVGYNWASARLHRFIMDGMATNARAFGAAGVTYYPYLERDHGEGSGLLETLAERACVVVTDEFPCFFLPRMVAAAGRKLNIRLEQVDGNGLLPLREADRDFTTAASFRRHLQKTLKPHLHLFPLAEPLEKIRHLPAAKIPKEVAKRWPLATPAMLEAPYADLLAKLPIDQSVGPVEERGGSEEGERVLHRFLDSRLNKYAELRNRPEEDVASGLSPYLHFGYVGVHQVVAEIFRRENWNWEDVSFRALGRRRGWWGLSEASEAFLDELVTWREIGYNFCFHHPDDYDQFATLPVWAKETLLDHIQDNRKHIYDLKTLEAAGTHDDLWNAAQRQLLREGRIHNYLRMLWGKKVLEWTPTPEAAAEYLIELNNKYALDGRNPNSYSGIFWTMGRFDRAWGPERPIYGKVRYMSSKNTKRKFRVEPYLERFAS